MEEIPEWTLDIETAPYLEYLPGSEPDDISLLYMLLLCVVSNYVLFQKQDPKYEFAKAIKANYYTVGVSSVFYITFQGKDPCGQPKLFQAEVLYCFYDEHVYISCNLKPDEKERTIRKIPPYLKYLPGSEPENAYVPYIRRGENERPDYTPEEEEVRMCTQVCETGGFDIDFKQFRGIFNYLPLNFDDDNNKYIVVKPETTRELMDRLSRGSLEIYNKDQRSKYEFVKAIKANFYMTSDASVMFYITFEGKDPCYGQPEHFQARVCYYYHDPPVYISCCLKQYNEIHFVETKDKGVKKSTETADKGVKKFTETADKGVKKPRLTEELSDV